MLNYRGVSDPELRKRHETYQGKTKVAILYIPSETPLYKCSVRSRSR